VQVVGSFVPGTCRDGIGTIRIRKKYYEPRTGRKWKEAYCKGRYSRPLRAERRCRPISHKTKTEWHVSQLTICNKSDKVIESCPLCDK
jgi:hypothetical protein